MFTLQKVNGRLHIIKNGKSVYSPPDFIRHKIRSKEDLQKVVDIFNTKNNYDIDAIVEFETNLRPEKSLFFLGKKKLIHPLQYMCLFETFLCLNTGINLCFTIVLV